MASGQGSVPKRRFCEIPKTVESNELNQFHGRNPEEILVIRLIVSCLPAEIESDAISPLKEAGKSTLFFWRVFCKCGGWVPPPPFWRQHCFSGGYFGNQLVSGQGSVPKRRFDEILKTIEAKELIHYYLPGEFRLKFQFFPLEFLSNLDWNPKFSFRIPK